MKSAALLSFVLCASLLLGCSKSPYDVEVPLGAAPARGPVTVRVSSDEIPLDVVGTKAKYANWMDELLVQSLEKRGFTAADKATQHLEVDLLWLATEPSAGAALCRLRARLSTSKEPEPPAPIETKKQKKRAKSAVAKRPVTMDIKVEAREKRRNKGDDRQLGHVVAEECVQHLVEYLEHPR